MKGMMTKMTDADYYTYVMDVTERVLINQEQEELQEFLAFDQKSDHVDAHSFAKTMPFSEAFSIR